MSNNPKPQRPEWPTCCDAARRESAHPSELERQLAQEREHNAAGLYPGGSLPNGYIVLALHLTKDGGLLLAKDALPKPALPLYVCWRLSPNLDPRSTHLGSYHDTFEDARITYLERLTGVPLPDGEHSHITE